MFKGTVRTLAAALALCGTASADVPGGKAEDGLCVPPSPGRTLSFAAGEKIELQIDAFGAVIGSFSMALTPGHRPDAFVILARGHTESVAADFYAVTGTAESHLGRDLEDLAYEEDSTENGVHRSQSMVFPPKEHHLAIHSFREGNPDDSVLEAPPDTRDMLATLYLLRSAALAPGEKFCIPVAGARRTWVLRGSVAGRESVTTPLGEYKTIHLAGSAVRLGGPRQEREIHLWLSDDADRIPVAAFGMIQGKPVGAQLVKYTPPRARQPR
jgi:hypothetical protein